MDGDHKLGSRLLNLAQSLDESQWRDLVERLAIADPMGVDEQREALAALRSTREFSQHHVGGLAEACQVAIGDPRLPSSTWAFCIALLCYDSVRRDGLSATISRISTETASGRLRELSPAIALQVCDILVPVIGALRLGEGLADLQGDPELQLQQDLLRASIECGHLLIQ